MYFLYLSETVVVLISVFSRKALAFLCVKRWRVKCISSEIPTEVNNFSYSYYKRDNTKTDHGCEGVREKRSVKL